MVVGKGWRDGEGGAAVVAMGEGVESVVSLVEAEAVTEEEGDLDGREVDGGVDVVGGEEGVGAKAGGGVDAGGVELGEERGLGGEEVAQDCA